jgi:2,3-bisphosphoglycerate-independent phosphoglycerate mutase
MTPYDDTFHGVAVIFEKDHLSYTLGEILSGRGMSQVRIAETEKYPHVTYFFNGGREDPFPLEDRIMVPSPKVATYDLKPEMSAFEVTNELLAYAEKKHPNFICVNYANPDMVGHTGDYPAIIQAVETIDQEVKRLVDKLSVLEYIILILADHGNADFAINPDGTPNTAHSMNPVPCILVNSSENDSLKDGVLADIAPTILALLGVEQPTEMTGKSLIKKGA